MVIMIDYFISLTFYYIAIADSLSNFDLLSSTEKSEVHVFIERSLARLKGADKELPQIYRMRSMLSRGIGVHHGGLLPIVKEVCVVTIPQRYQKIIRFISIT